MMTRPIRVVILFLVCLGGTTSDHVGAKRLLASVREKPRFLHKCMATFLSPTALIATASCLVCNNDCSMFIRVIRDKLEDPTAPTYDVREVVNHPHYKGKEAEYDVGIIFLEEAASNVRTVELPPEHYPFSGVSATIYMWVFSANEKIYYLREVELMTVSNNICSAALSDFIPCNYLCVYTRVNLTLGPNDLASPVISNGTYIVGILPHHGDESSTNVEKYESLFLYLDWIKDTLKANASKSLH